MKLSEKKQQQIEYKEFTKMYERAKKAADKFIRANSKVDPDLQIKYL